MSDSVLLFVRLAQSEASGLPRCARNDGVFASLRVRLLDCRVGGRLLAMTVRVIASDSVAIQGVGGER